MWFHYMFFLVGLMAEPQQPEELQSIVGSGMARFLNQYNPYHNKPYERPTANQGVYLDPDLQSALEAERKATAARQHNKKKDWMKSYMDECVKFQSITKGGKK